MLAALLRDPALLALLGFEAFLVAILFYIGARHISECLNARVNRECEQLHRERLHRERLRAMARSLEK